MHQDIKALIFDLDGTLYVNGGLGREINQAACRYMADLKGVDADAADRMIRAARKRLSALTGVDTTLTLACMDLGADIKELHRRFSDEIEPSRFLARDRRVVEFLKVLADKFELYLYTNNNVGLASRVMEAIGVTGLFSQVFTIEYSWRPKPDRKALEDIFLAIGRRADECLFVGDRYDVDLRMPAEMGSAIFLVKSVEELFPLCKLLNEEIV